MTLQQNVVGSPLNTGKLKSYKTKEVFYCLARFQIGFHFGQGSIDLLLPP